MVTPDSQQDSPRNYVALFEHSARMRAIGRTIVQVANTDATVLIRGDSGVGKEVAAKAVHALSPRRDRPFIKVNCAALPAGLLESELFGHQKGAFTGAYRQKPGKFELADGGTMFLDEIGDMAIALQPKLLHVLQDGEFTRIGGSERIKVDVRVVASTNRPLEDAIRRERFREDLYYRLNVITLKLPPLRERRDEIRGLADTFLRRFNTQYGRQVSLSEDSIEALVACSWPGNVRELQNLIKRVVVLDNAALILDELAVSQPPAARGAPLETVAPPPIHGVVAGPPMAAMPPPHRPHVSAQVLREAAQRAAINAEREILRDLLHRVRWNRAEAARLLGLSFVNALFAHLRGSMALFFHPSRIIRVRTSGDRAGPVGHSSLAPHHPPAPHVGQYSTDSAQPRAYLL